MQTVNQTSTPLFFFCFDQAADKKNTSLYNNIFIYNNIQILTLPLFRPSQKCPETGCVLPAVGAGERPRQREVRQERVHLPRHPDHPRPPRHDPGVRGKLIRAKYFKPNVFGTI